MTEDEKEIIEGCRRGDTECQKRLYLNFGPMIKGVCTRYTSDPSEAEDLFHDVFVFILTNFDDFNKVYSLGGWLHTVTVNKAIDYVRKKGLYGVDPMSKYDIDIPDTQGRNYDGLSMNEILGFVRMLPGKYRTAFNLFVIDGIPQEEISRLMGESRTNVRTLVSRAKAMLRVKIDEYLKKDNLINKEYGR